MQKADSPPVTLDIPFTTAPQIIFTNWHEALHRSGLSATIRTVYAMAIEGYLDNCAHNWVSVTTESARAHMEDVMRRGVARQPER